MITAKKYIFALGMVFAYEPNQNSMKNVCSLNINCFTKNFSHCA